MKIRFYLFRIFSVAFVTLLLVCCNSSYDKMIEDFNDSHFEKSYLPPEPYTTSSNGFNELEMLEETISMLDDSITVITAPDGGSGCSYEWKAHVPCKDTDGKDFMKETVIGSDRTLSYKAPGVFNSDKENKLTLTVTEASGKQYTDTAKVFITIE